MGTCLPIHNCPKKDTILYSWGRSLFFDFNGDVTSFPNGDLGRVFLYIRAWWDFPRITVLHLSLFLWDPAPKHIVPWNFVKHLLPKAAVLFQTSFISHCLFNTISYGGLALTSYSLMQVMDPIPVTGALCLLGHLLFQFELRLSLLHSIKKNRKLFPLVTIGTTNDMAQYTSLDFFLQLWSGKKYDSYNKEKAQKQKEEKSIKEYFGIRLYLWFVLKYQVYKN